MDEFKQELYYRLIVENLEEIKRNTKHTSDGVTWCGLMILIAVLIFFLWAI